MTKRVKTSPAKPDQSGTATRNACISKPCRAPVACEGWGYCRERHFLPDEDPRYRSPRAPYKPN